MKSIQITKNGGPEVLELKEIKLDKPKENEVTIEQKAIGLNYIDTYHRSGLYPLKLPTGIGAEGSGVITDVGSDVKNFKIGDKVAYGIPPLGSYSEFRNYPADKLLHLPLELDDKEVASILMKGMTAQYLLHRTYKVKKDDTVLIHAAAGGMGLILCQWAKAIGATVIGTVSTTAKAELAKEAGCDYPIIRSCENFVKVVKEVTNGVGCDVVYEAIGKDTLQQSLDSLKPMGMCAAYGHVSGPPDPIDVIQDLGRRGSLLSLIHI